jgi:hypothetical protein
VKLVAVLAVALAAAVSTALANAGDARNERFVRDARDQASAVRSGLQASDAPGWTFQRTARIDLNVDWTCAGFSPDMSRFTITGYSRAGLTTAGKSATSSVEVFRTAAEATADYKITTSAPGLACQKAALVKSLQIHAPPGMSATPPSWKTRRVRPNMVVAVAETTLKGAGASLPVSVLAYEFLQGRVTGEVFFEFPSAAPMPEIEKLLTRVMVRSAKL